MARKYDYVGYYGGAPQSAEPERKSTIHELAAWMNNMAHSIGIDRYHWVTEGELHAVSVSPNGTLDWGIV
jgi:hypothetical protein